ncbi:MAG: hypothetical protein AVDCRST_MAG62-1773 [uncultured Sphingomonas sp.]|uniref:Uncharacterized protein n=1 Tax=uncultured Sphingomonas sp. TaxID=158754 RepID=A0A6J4TSK0_9SPHN|nr:MAG: hypothetical protein AVDCRST_MAG62-1773 [uncultured Sphingomonas sp.]
MDAAFVDIRASFVLQPTRTAVRQRTVAAPLTNPAHNS